MTSKLTAGNKQMKKIFKNFFRHKTKYVLLFFCLAVLVAPLLTAAQATAPATETPGAITRALSNVGDALSIVGGAIGKIAGGVIGGILGSTIAWIVYVLNYIVATIFAVFISIIAWFIGIVIQINTNIVNTPIVQNGFSITLALANLGFVLAIIVIAIMTILRYETYALKKTLWKLVAAAILVNFSLVIAAAILNFADNLTLYFLNGFNQGCTTGTSTGVPGITNSPFDCFATSVAGAFAPQRVFLTSPDYSAFDSAKFGGAAGAGQTFAGVITPFLNLFFPTIFMIIATIALAGLFIMLLIRYVYLGILLILMPIVWLLWIFPVTSNQWHKWWSKFIQWTMFAPVVMFFIYLSILSLGVNNNSNPDAFLAALRVQSSGENSALVTGVSNFLGNTASTVLGTTLQMAIMVSLLFAGLYMAQAMGIMFADMTIKGATAITSGFGRLVGRKSLQTGGMALNKLKVREGAERLQQTKFGHGMSKWNPLRYAGAVANYGTGWLGRGMENITVATREDLVQGARKRFADKTDDQLKNEMSTLNAHERVAAAQMLFERGAIEKIDPESDIGSDFKAFNQEGYLKKFNKQGQFANDEILSAMPDAMEGNFTKLDDAVQKFIATLSKSDISSNKQLNDIFGGGKFMGRDADQMKVLNETMIKHMAVNSPQLLAAIIPKLRSEALQNFGKMFELAKGDMTPEQREKAEGRFDTMINNNIFYAGTGPSGPETTPPPSAAH